MSPAQYLQDGTLRLSAPGCTLLWKRLRPGLVLMSVRGRDEGQFGRSRIELLEAEWKRFRVPLQWFIDARLAVAPDMRVLDQWREWLAANAQNIAKVHVLTTESRRAVMTGLAARLPFQTEASFYFSPEDFEAELQTRKVRTNAIQYPRWDDPPDAVELSDTRLTCPDYTCHFDRLSSLALVVRISGDDCGQLSSALFDRMNAALDAAPGPFTLFLDVQDVGMVGPEVTEEWRAWLTAHRDRLECIHVLDGMGLLPLVLSAARERLQLGRKLRLVSERAEFQTLVARSRVQ